MNGVKLQKKMSTNGRVVKTTQIIAHSLSSPLQGGGLVFLKNDHTIPQAYLNFLFFDKNMNYKAGGFKQVTENALYSFEEITLDFTPHEEGYRVANDPMKFIDPDGMDGINTDMERRNQARSNARTARDNASNEHLRNMASNNANANMSKKEMKNAGVWGTQKALNKAEKQYNRTDRQFNRAKQTFQQTQGAIDALRINDPATFDRLNNLTYIGRVVNVHVTSSAAIQNNQHGAQTAAQFSPDHNSIYTLLPDDEKPNYTLNAITVRLQSGVRDPDVKLAHEAGHVFGIVRDPANYFRNFRRGVDC